MATNLDLWGEIAPSAVRTPASILKEQASLLGAKTQHMIEGEVVTSALGSSFYHSFLLVVPSLDEYKYKLFEIHHGVSPYPVSVLMTDLPDEDRFVAWLRDTLSSAETKSIIGNLLAQARS